ncbi:MAG: hypothetical protein CMK79_03810 [Pseudomonadales bacterium]|nr:hypothetical protein [Pseudomonadales bacterium]
MGSYKYLAAGLLLPVFLLAGCGGGGGGSDVFEDDDSENQRTISDSTEEQEQEQDDESTPTNSDGISYLPLSVYESFKEFSGADQDGVFASDYDAPWIKSYLISPVASATLQPVANAQVANYSVKVDGIEISPAESFPLLQKVIGVPTSLQTALVFDISGSMSDVSMQALVDEAKTYLAQVQLSSNPMIASQQFTLWVFANEPRELTSGFTNDIGTLNGLLDQIVTLYDAVDLGYGTSIHRTVVEAIGRYNKDDYAFDADGDNDLVDRASKNGIALSQLVIFSSGSETSLEMDVETMSKAIQSQAFVKYTRASTSNTRYQYKPVFYYVVGGTAVGETYTPLSVLAEATDNLTLVAGEYSYAESLIANQINAVEERIDLDNQYVYRFAFVPRVGDHQVIFSSKSTTNSYRLFTDIDGDDLSPGTGAPIEELTNELIEITGPNGEYIANAIIDFSVAQTFRPATRWTTLTYGASDYSWSLSGGTGTTNSDGSYTVDSVTTPPAVLTLTNNTIGGYSAQLVIVE